jgi:hypothetical protein
MFMLCLHNKMHDIILISAIIISMMISLNKHIYDILCKSYFWNKLNMILPIFVIDRRRTRTNLHFVYFAL